MAEETLVKEALSNEMIEAGRALVGNLEKRGWDAASAFWYFESEQARWRLILSSPLAESYGSAPAYDLVVETLASHPEWKLDLNEISILAPRKEPVKSLASALNVDRDSRGVRFSRNTINGKYIADAFIDRTAGSTPR